MWSSWNKLQKASSCEWDYSMITLHKFGSSLVVLTIPTKYTWEKDIKKLLAAVIQQEVTFCQMEYKDR